MKFVLRSAAREDILRQYEYYLTEANAVIAARFLYCGSICDQPDLSSARHRCAKAAEQPNAGGVEVVACQRFRRYPTVLPRFGDDASARSGSAW